MNKTDLIRKIKQLEGISQDERSYLINLQQDSEYLLVIYDEEVIGEQVKNILDKILDLFNQS